MIELNALELLAYIVTIFSSGASIGYLYGKAIGEKQVVTTMDCFCEAWSKHGSGNPSVVLINGKRVNTNCPKFQQKGNKCTLTNKKCTLLT